MKYIDALDSTYSNLDENLSYESDTVETIDRKLLFEYVNETIETLCERESICIRGRIDGLTLKEISITCKVSTERIRQIISKAIRKLRHPLRKDKLRYVMNHMSKFDIEEEKEERRKEKEKRKNEKEAQELKEKEDKQKHFLERQQAFNNFMNRRLNPIIKEIPSYLKLELDDRGKRCIKMSREDWARTTPEIARSWLNFLIEEENKTSS